PRASCPTSSPRESRWGSSPRRTSRACRGRRCAAAGSPSPAPRSRSRYGRCTTAWIRSRPSHPRSEPGEEEVDRLVERQIAAPQIEGEDDRRHEDDDRGTDHLVAIGPGHLLHLRGGVAPEVSGGGGPLLRFRYDRVAGFFHWVSRSLKQRSAVGSPPTAESRQPTAAFDVAGQEGLEPPTCGFGDRCSTN